MTISHVIKKDKLTKQLNTEIDNFGQIRTDHIFLMDYDGESWTNPRIVPYDSLDMKPGSIVLHYGQAIFEGLKAFRHPNGELYLFRADKNAKRLNNSAKIMCMPEIDEEDFIQSVRALVDVERLWLPNQENICFYIRPFMFASEDSLGIHVSKTYTFCIMLSPSGDYYKVNNPSKILITEKYHRAVKGGSGQAKAIGNYGTAFRSLAYAKNNFGACQVLYLDQTNTYLEEVGSMNHFHITKDKDLIIPTFTDTILRSITSESIIELRDVLKGRFNITVKQEMIKKDDFIADIENGNIIEAGGLGTAAVVSSVGSYVLDSGKVLTVSEKAGKLTNEVRNLYLGIQNGTIEIKPDWLIKV